MRKNRTNVWVVAAAALSVWAIGSSPAASAGEAKYAGTTSCKKCHMASHHKSWAVSKHAQAFEVLRPDSELKETEASKKIGLTAKRIAEIKANKKKGDPAIDADKDYTKDKTCLACHTVGFGKPGGYALADPKEKDKTKIKKAAKAAEAREGVGCESCHGPGAEYNKLFTKIKKEKLKYSPDELYKIGLTKMSEKTCLDCHNEKSPYFKKGDKFDYEKHIKGPNIHNHVKLKQRK